MGQSVADFLATLEHPRKHEIEVLRSIILSADPQISEGIKWNAPSFRTTEYFATFHLRTQDRVQLILHLGAKKRATTTALVVADPAELLTWISTDRAAVTFRNLDEIYARRTAFADLVRAWIAFV